MSSYNTLRTWSAVLIALGVVSLIFAGAGVVAWAIQIDGVWETLGVIFFGGPIVLLLAAWPMAIGQAMRALADVGDAVVFRAPDRLPADLG